MRVAVLAAQNLNLVDGSTIWLLNLCRLLASLPGLQTTLILRETLVSRVLAGDLPTSVALIEPRLLGRERRMAPHDAPSVLRETEQQRGRFDRIIVRGDGFLSALLSDEDYSGKVIAYRPSAEPRLGALAPEWIAQARRCRAPLLTQSVTGKAIFETFHDYPAGLVEVLPPVANIPKGLLLSKERAPLLGYSGKIDPAYGLDWLCDLAERRASERGFAVTVVAGKSNAGPDMSSVARFEALAEQPPPDIAVHRNLPHNAALSEMARMRFGYCLRSADYDASVEISTKVLEFCALGVVPILNDNALNRDMLGRDYPFLFDVGQPDVAGRVARRLRHATDQDIETARAKIAVLAETASPQKGTAVLAKVLGVSSIQSGKAAPITLRVATHDDKFLGRFLDRAAHDPCLALIRDRWRGIGDAGGAPAPAAAGDTIFCEWCGENAVWHSHNKLKGARLIVRLHRFEAFRDFPARVNWAAVDRLIVVSEHFKTLMIETHGIPPEKIEVLPQYVDCSGLKRAKRPGARFRIGFVGLVPFGHKRLDRAVDFLAAIRAIDPRFLLLVRGVMPWKVGWAWQDRPDDRRDFERVFQRIFTDPDLAGAIRFDPPGADMEEWFRDVGFILSTSETEGCHTAIMEGLASGAMPIVRNWLGASGLYGEFVHPEAEDAIPKVIAHATAEGWEDRCEAFAARAGGWDVELFNNKMMELIA
jgi:glycosyltransferase involved in cell wall biosynthesis